MSLAILGAGGHGRVVADCAHVAGWTDIVFFDDGPALARAGPWSVKGSARDLSDRVAEFKGLIVAIGDNATRLDWHERLNARGGRLVSLIHPGAIVSAHAQVGAGTVVLAGACVNIGARTGSAVIVNTGATVDHDCALADGVHIAPGASLAGGVTIGRLSWIGTGAAVRPGVVIGRDVRIEAGAAIVEAVPDGATVVGNPARLLER